MPEILRHLLLLAILSAGASAPADLVSAHALCEDKPRCSGCGCKGGPGYRSRKTGKCVGFKQLTKQCGSPPETKCIFENAPGTGENAKCVMHTHHEKNQ